MPASQHGRATAFTVLTPIRRRRHLPVLAVALWIARRTGLGTRRLVALRLIHVARFTPLRRGRRRWLLFESTFDGRWNSYIDAFGFVVPTGFRAIWGGDPAFPGPRPVTEMKRYVREHEALAEHFWIAHSEASVRTRSGALEVRDRLRALAADEPALDDATLARRVNELLAESAHVL